MKKLIILILLLGIYTAAFSQKIVEKTQPVNNEQEVFLDFDFAKSISIKGWDKNEVYVKAVVNINDNENNDAFSLNVTKDNSSVNFTSDIEDLKEISKNRVTIREWKDGKRTITYNDGYCTDLDISFEVFLPKKMGINTTTINGDITLTDVDGTLSIKTISGFIDLKIDKSTKASIKTSTISGSVYTDHDVNLNNKLADKKYKIVIGRSPDFDLNGGGKSINLKTISGDIYIRK